MAHSSRYLGKIKCPYCKGGLHYSNLEGTRKLVCKKCNIIIIPKEKILPKGYRV